MDKIIKLGIIAKIGMRNEIRISAYSVKDFLNYIGECPVNCYRYKWKVYKYANILL